MKKSDLKILIKECIKDVIFEEGVLSGIITEVANGMNLVAGRSVVNNSSSPKTDEIARQSAAACNLMEEKREEVLKVISSNSYDDLKQKFSNPEFFKGTTPLTENKGQSSLSGVPSVDSGLEISSIPGFENWGHVAKKTD